MIWQYLKSNIKGAASGVLYGKIGDKVYVVLNQGEMLLVVNEIGEKFYVREDEICSSLNLIKINEVLSLQGTSIRKTRSKR